MRQIIYIDNFLTGHGHTPTTGTTLVKQFRSQGYTVIPSSSKNNKVLRLVEMISTIIRHRKNSVVLIATYSQAAFYFASACGLVCRIFKIPYIPCLHGGNLPNRIKKSPRLSSVYFANSYTNVAVSGYLGASMTNNGWKCLEIPNNIPLEKYKFMHRLQVSPTLFWVRSFHSNYNPQLAIRVLFQVRQRYPNTTLTMVGPDKDDHSLDKCKHLIKELQLENYIALPGLMTRTEWTKLSEAHDIFINTTNFDNLPVSVIEGMALGMVIISTSVGGVPFLIEQNKTGILVPPENEEAFFNAIIKVLEEPEFAANLSLEANKKAQQFDWNNIKVLWANLLTNIPAN